MTRKLILAGVATAAFAASPADAAPDKVQRTVVGHYEPYPSPVTGCNSPLGSWACMIVSARAGEEYFSVRVRDTHGLPVYFTVMGAGGATKAYCGETKQPVLLHGQTLEIEVGISRWVVQTDCPASSVKTTGTIEVTFSNVA